MYRSNQSIESTPTIPSGLLSMGQACELVGVSAQSLRSYERQGRLVAYRTLNNGLGHRRYRRADLLACFGVPETEGDTEGKRVGVYVRVSTKAQKPNLDRQLERLLDAVAEREGVPKESIAIYQDVCSSFGQRVGLNRMVDDCYAGKLSAVFVENADRLSRVPALTRLFEHVCKANGVKLVALDREELNLDEQTQFVQELIEFVHVVSVRQQARKVAERRRKKLDVSAIQWVKEQLEQGRSIRDTAALAGKVGLRTEKGEVVSVRTVRRYATTMVKMQGGEAKSLEVEGANSFKQFVGEHLKRKRGCKVQSESCHSAYLQWCQKKGIQPLAAKLNGAWLRKEYGVTVKCGYTWLNDVEILGYPSLTPHARGEFAKLYDNGIRGVYLAYAGRKGTHKPKAK